jgi:hypothetical protein
MGDLHRPTGSQQEDDDGDGPVGLQVSSDSSLFNFSDPDLLRAWMPYRMENPTGALLLPARLSSKYTLPDLFAPN